jgi:predicted transcriptional regulator
MEYYNTRGRKRMALDSRSKKIHIFEGQTISIAQLQHKRQQVHDELEEWRCKCTNLEADMQKLYGEMETAINEKTKGFQICVQKRRNF